MLTSQQRAWLRAKANALPSQFQIGKNERTDAVAKSVDELLSTHELVKGHALKSVDEPVRKLAHRLAESVDAQVVLVIGRKFVLYRHSEKLQKQGKALRLP